MRIDTRQLRRRVYLDPRKLRSYPGKQSVRLDLALLLEEEPGNLQKSSPAGGSSGGYKYISKERRNRKWHYTYPTTSGSGRTHASTKPDGTTTIKEPSPPGATTKPPARKSRGEHNFQDLEVWKKDPGKRIGANSSNGQVYVHDDRPELAIKIGKIPESEYEISKEAENLGVGPKVYGWQEGPSKKEHRLAMEFLVGFKSQAGAVADFPDSKKLERGLARAIRQVGILHQHGIAHRDLHSNNIMFNNYRVDSTGDVKARLIDFGRARKGNPFELLKDVFDTEARNKGTGAKNNGRNLEHHLENLTLSPEGRAASESAVSHIKESLERHEKWAEDVFNSAEEKGTAEAFDETFEVRKKIDISLFEEIEKFHAKIASILDKENL